MKNISLVPTIFLLLLISCKPAPEPIEFGVDACAHCRMTIVEKPFAAELVSKKGKVYKFDAIECQMDFLKNMEENDIAILLVRDYDMPDEWQDAKQCSYLISNEIPSPMGAFLSAYKDKEAAEIKREDKGGEVLDWDGLKRSRQ